MTLDHGENPSGQVPRIPTRGLARVDGLASLRVVARSMVESGVEAVLVESPLGPVGFATAHEVIEAVAGGADPDTCWATEISHPPPRMVSWKQHPAAVGREMSAYGLEFVMVVDEDKPLGVASALDVLSAVLRGTKESR